MNSNYAESIQQNRRRGLDQNDFEVDQDMYLPPHLRQGSSSLYAHGMSNHQYSDYNSTSFA